jgi:hypothetical protein
MRLPDGSGYNTTLEDFAMKRGLVLVLLFIATLMVSAQWATPQGEG